jgi:uncharacterized protein YjiS (DUF1127 family)
MNTPLNTRRPIDLYPFEDTVRRAAWSWLSKRVAAVVAAYRAQVTMRALSQLTDGQLSDIGLRRHDIERIAAQSASGDH